MVYFDYNATAPLRAAARDAMLEWLGRPGNPSAAHGIGRDAAMAVDRARTHVANLVGWPRDGVVFTGGASESNATVLSRGRWAASAVDHPSVRLWATTLLPVDANGVVSIEAIREVQGVDGVSVMLANNEAGTVQPIAEVIAVARSRGLRVHVDAAQASGRVALDMLQGADFITLASHKLGGPQGVGAICVPKGDSAPMVRGAQQERGWRAGTHNVAGIAGFGAATLEILLGDLLSPVLRDRLEAGLVAFGGVVAGGGAPRLPNTSFVAFPGVPAPELVMMLDLQGVCVSAGSACASGSARPSDVLAAMGFQGSAVRFSLGRESTAAEVDLALGAVRTVLDNARAWV